MDTGITGGENPAAIGAGAALPVGDDAAGAFDNGDKSGYIPAMETRLDDQIDKTQRENAEDVAVAAEPGHADGLLDTAESIVFVRREVGIGMRGAKNGLREILARPHPERRMRAACGNQLGDAISADEALAEHRLIDDSQHRASIFFQSNQRGPLVASGNEGAGPVDRIEQ